VWKGDIECPSNDDKDAADAMAFLDQMQSKHGEKSVIYVRQVILSSPLASTPAPD
jgi:hypothetical protein